MENRYCIVRCENAGVFAGIVKERSGREVTLTDCRRLWYWEGAASCSQLAVDGTKKPHECKFTVAVPEMIVLDAIEIIPCTQDAEKSIRGVFVWKI